MQKSKIKVVSLEQNGIIYEPAHDKTYNKISATLRPRSLIRVLADCMCLLQPAGYPKRNK